MPKDISTYGLEEPGVTPPIFWLVGDPVEQQQPPDVVIKEEIVIHFLYRLEPDELHLLFLGAQLPFLS